MGISLFLGESKRLPEWFGALIFHHNSDFTIFQMGFQMGFQLVSKWFQMV